ncbi:CRISPR-associated endonuclease Cas1 [Hyperthermus butylicus]|uniref:CRISPR-associated endonuclease Cas1 n=1 Tax=Hyperthermus butylicus (strain DSM 5456 / JCM 9403 / PLM1-5) TaxID=415426 RepID=CAS1_HYPBU|nr:CRISPR-associated endonuclease Cas1 [Hyperthermus butylicus]A2BKJ8.1 RecName: Full=CRISPR-associated endonuclease Cas1 [Hyperthermus butylicus DSM 5456]ABM80509.1 universally conserved protein [Hyperthermus butylicus DSM 5456]
MPEVLLVATPGTRIYVRRGVVYAEAPSGEKAVVTADTELVVLATGSVSVSGRALRRLAELGVRLVVLGQRGQVVAEHRPVDRVNRTIEARMEQYRVKATGEALYYAAEMVYAKIVNQAKLLRYLAKSRREPWLRDAGYRVEGHADRLRQIIENEEPTTPEVIRSIEAQAARDYWDAIAQIAPTPFPGRQPRGEDHLNMALSYGYAILYSIAHDALTVAGLDPYAGFLHADRSGRPSLTYDYADTYKPIAVDKPLLTAPRKTDCLDTYMGALTYNARRCIATLVLENIYKTPYPDSRGRKKTLRDHIYTYAWNLAAAIRQHKPYKPFIVGRL